MKIRLKITMFFFGLTLFILFAFGSLIYLEIRHVMYESIRDSVNFISQSVADYIKNNYNDKDFIKKIEKESFFNENWILIILENKIIYSSERTKQVPLNIGYNQLNKFFLTKKYINDIYRIGILPLEVQNKRFYIVSAVLINERDGELRIIFFSILIGFLVFSTFIFFSGLLFSKYILTPFVRITKKMNEISTENLSERINWYSKDDEVGNLSNSINHLFDRLENSFSLQKKFIGDVSHELKTPISILRLSLETMQNDEKLPLIYQNKISSSLDVVFSMNFLIKKLLLLAKLDEIKNPLKFEKTELNKILIKIHENLSIIAADKNIKFIINLPKEKTFFEIDNELFYIAIFNIIENAIKYTQKGFVSISLLKIENKINIEITDSGVGISKDKIDKIFERFFRIENPAYESQGYGIGLSISKKIIELHNGKIKVVSKLEKGTTFLITI
jgi:two-component system, OmpR family, sensor histidine kinase ArlS